MQISLKQREIEKAIKAYIADQGFSLKGKEVTIDFTAGRKEAGLSADVNIEDAGSAVNTAAQAPLGKVTEAPDVTIKPAAVQAQEPAAEEQATATASAPKSSLFGG